MIGRKTGFSLIEVVLAVAILGFTIVAVVGLLGTTSRAISDVRDTTSAARLSQLLQAELERTGFETLTTSQNDPLVLYGTPAGDHVALASTANAFADNYNSTDPLLDSPLPNSTRPRGIAPRDRYYRIVVTRIQNGSNPNRHLQFNAPGLNNPGSVSFSVQVEWPFNVPQGPGANDAVRFDEDLVWDGKEPSPEARVAYYYMSLRP